MSECVDTGSSKKSSSLTLVSSVSEDVEDKNQQVAAEVKEAFPELVIEPAIRRNIKLAEAPSHGLPIHLHDPNSNGGQDYQKVSSVLESRWGL